MLPVAPTTFLRNSVCWMSLYVCVPAHALFDENLTLDRFDTRNF